MLGVREAELGVIWAELSLGTTSLDRSSEWLPPTLCRLHRSAHQENPKAFRPRIEPFSAVH